MVPVASPRNTGKANLAKARFFLSMVELAEKSDPFDQSLAETYLDAAIVFGKATQDWMGEQFGKPEEENSDQSVSRRRKAAKTWLKSTSLWDDPVCKLLADTRDIIVHEDGTVDLITRAGVRVFASASVLILSGSTAIATVTPANPTPEQLDQIRQERERDLAERERQRQVHKEEVERIKAEYQLRAQERAHAHPDEKIIRVHFNVDDPDISDAPAVDFVRNYLDLLERVLDDQMSE